MVSFAHRLLIILPGASAGKCHRIMKGWQPPTNLAVTGTVGHESGIVATGVSVAEHSVWYWVRTGKGLENKLKKAQVAVDAIYDANAILDPAGFLVVGAFTFSAGFFYGLLQHAADYQHCYTSANQDLNILVQQFDTFCQSFLQLPAQLDGYSVFDLQGYACDMIRTTKNFQKEVAKVADEISHLRRSYANCWVWCGTDVPATVAGNMSLMQTGVNTLLIKMKDLEDCDSRCDDAYYTTWKNGVNTCVHSMCRYLDKAVCAFPRNDEFCKTLQPCVQNVIRPSSGISMVEMPEKTKLQILDLHAVTESVQFQSQQAVVLEHSHTLVRNLIDDTQLAQAEQETLGSRYNNLALLTAGMVMVFMPLSTCALRIGAQEFCALAMPVVVSTMLGWFTGHIVPRQFSLAAVRHFSELQRADVLLPIREMNESTAAFMMHCSEMLVVSSHPFLVGSNQEVDQRLLAHFISALDPSELICYSDGSATLADVNNVSECISSSLQAQEWEGQRILHVYYSVTFITALMTIFSVMLASCALGSGTGSSSRMRRENTSRRLLYTAGLLCLCSMNGFFWGTTSVMGNSEAAFAALNTWVATQVMTDLDSVPMDKVDQHFLPLVDNCVGMGADVLRTLASSELKMANPSDGQLWNWLVSSWWIMPFMTSLVLMGTIFSRRKDEQHRDAHGYALLLR